jgi:hypothetical protein
MSLRLGLIMLPTSLAEWARLSVSFSRVEEFLALAEHVPLPHPALPPHPPSAPTPSAGGSGHDAQPIHHVREVLARLCAGSYRWGATEDRSTHPAESGGGGGGGSDGKEGFELRLGAPVGQLEGGRRRRSINSSSGGGGGGVEVMAGAVIGVTGLVGAGKSSLLCALLGEMPPCSGHGSGQPPDGGEPAVSILESVPY